MQEYARELCERAARSFRELDLFRDLYGRAYSLGMPERDGWNLTAGQGERKHRTVYDSDYADAWERLVNALVTGMTPDWARWAEYASGSAVPKDDRDEMEELLQAHGESFFDALDASNFYSEIHGYYADVIAGTAHLLTLDDDPDVDFRCMTVPNWQVGIEEGPSGRVDGHFWKQKVRARHLERTFPKTDFPDSLRGKIRNAPDEDVEVLNCTVGERRGDRHFKQCVVYEPEKLVLEERWFYENPWATCRWSKYSGETLGRGPALKVEPGAYSANEATKLMLMAANLSLFGMWLYDAGRINPDLIQFGTGALVPVQVDGSEKVSNYMAPLTPAANFDVGQMMGDRLGSQVQRGLYRDQLGPVQKPNMTATEVIERQKLVAQDLGASYIRLKTEFLVPVMQRITGILARKGKLPDFKLDGKLVKLRFTSALARAQKFEEVAALREIVGDIANMAQIDPGAAVALRPVKILRRIAALRGAPLDVLPTEEEAEADAQRLGALQAQAAMGEQEAAG